MENESLIATVFGYPPDEDIELPAGFSYKLLYQEGDNPSAGNERADVLQILRQSGKDRHGYASAYSKSI
ncbi:MAG: hypothetical protein HMLIMOIP_002605 [Candidatus Nitrosomirales archaeon]|jgi:hypothetical protein